MLASPGSAQGEDRFQFGSGDLITDFMAYTKWDLSPEIFRRWAAISLVAGTLERRVWVKTGRLVAYPSLYTLLVAPPGVGKFVINEVRELWQETLEPGTVTPSLKVAPNSVTKASLMDMLGKSTTTKIPLGASEPITYSSLLVAAEEFGVLLPAYDGEFISVLTDIYNNKKEHHETRRTGRVQDLKIPYPQLNILAGTQPAWMAHNIPEEAWATGFTARFCMIYASDVPLKDIFTLHGAPEEERASLLRDLGKVAQLYGEAKWEPEALAALSAWYFSGQAPLPTHSKLEHYSRRRMLHVTKLALVACVSRGQTLAVSLRDLERGWMWMFEAEALMPDIFRAMMGKSDVTVLEELHIHAFALWARNGKEPIHERSLMAFLSARVPSDKMLRLMEVAERAGYVDRVAGTDCMYVPRARLGGTTE